MIFIIKNLKITFHKTGLTVIDYLYLELEGPHTVHIKSTTYKDLSNHFCRTMCSSDSTGNRMADDFISQNIVRLFSII